MSTFDDPVTPAGPRVPAPGYYPDPATGVSRWWDGASWGAFVQPSAVPPQPANQAVGTSGYAIAALVLGILWGYGVGSVLAIIFGVIGRKQCDRGERTGRGMATAGLVLGIVGLAGLLLIILVAVGASSTSTYSY